jgi:TRAP-type C4-dicarboxylate transport system permease small subunit
MRALGRLADGAVRLLALCGSVGVIAMMLHVCADVVLRGLFASPIPATVEVVSHYYMVLIAFLPLAWVERGNGMVSVELFDGVLPAGVLRASDFLVAVLAAVIYGLLAWASLGIALGNYATGTFVLALEWRVPTWGTYFLPPLGFALAGLVVLVRAGQIAVGAERAP